MKSTSILPPHPARRKKQLRKINCNELMNENEEPFFSGSFTIPPTPQKTVAAFPVQKLINYLTRNRSQWEALDLKKLDLVIHDVISRKDDSELMKLLKSHGWNGFRFSFASDSRTETLSALLQELSNLYLRQKSVFFANKLSAMYGNGDASNSAFGQLASFAPNVLLQCLTHEISSASAKSVEFSGACMLVDISGFSMFSGSMCLQGVSGLDGLREITNGFLGHFVKQVYAFDGDVVAFAGDALICVFLDKPPSPHSSSSPLRPSTSRSLAIGSSYRALECACVLRSHKNEHLSTHIAVSYGDMSYALLGGHGDQWVGVLNGQCVTELSEAITRSNSQEVVTTQACLSAALAAAGPHREDDSAGEDSSDSLLIQYDVLADTSSVRILSLRPLSPSSHRKGGAAARQGHVFKRSSSRIEAYNLDESVLIERLVSVVPRPIMSAVYSGTLNHIGELRQVTTLFLALDSYDAQTHGDPTTLQEFVAMAQQTLSESGGFLRQFLVDDKGCVLIAMWGTPSFTYSNNCSRALHCAVQLKHRSATIQHACSIGITTGVAFCGCVGTPQRRDYVGIGSEVNMAARLMSKAHGRVLVDVSTYSNLDEATRRLLLPAEQLVLKGALEPCSPYQYASQDLPNLAALDTEAIRNQMLKRNVMALIAKRLDVIGNDTCHRRGAFLFANPTSSSAASTSSAYFTVLLAPLGNGNFAAEYFRHCARKRGIACVSVSAQPSYRHTPYNVVKQLFLELVGYENFVTEEQQRFMIDFLVRQAYSKSREHERNNAKISLQLALGVDWVSDADVAHFHRDNGREALALAPAPMLSGKEAPRKHLARKAGDLAFYKVFAYLAKQAPMALVIENAQYCDELSWNELRLVMLGKELSISVLITMKASNNGNNMAGAGAGVHSLYDRFRHTQHRLMWTASGTGSIPAPGLGSVKLNLSQSLSAVAEPTMCSEGEHPSTTSISLMNEEQCNSESDCGTGMGLGISSSAGSGTGPSSPDGVSASVVRLIPGSVVGAGPVPPPAPEAATPLAVSTRRADTASGLTTLPSFFTSRLEEISPGSPDSVSLHISGSSSSVTSLSASTSTSSRASLSASSPDSHFTIDTNPSPSRFYSPDHRRPSTAGVTIYTSVVKPPMPGSASARTPSGAMRYIASPVEMSPFKEDATKFGLDFIPSEACRFVLNSAQTTIVKIAGLTDEEVQDMLCGALKVSSVSSELVKLVLDISSGNAFWCKQIVQFVTEQGVDAMEKTIKFGLSRHNPLKLLILLRLEKLSTEQQLVLKVASVVGEEFSEHLMSALLPARMQVNVTECLEALIEHDFLCKVQDHPTELYGFQNQIIQDTLYELSPPSDSALLHGKIAELLEEEYASDLRPHYPSLASHFRCAGQHRTEACKYAVKSADYALSRGAFHDALAFAVEAAETADSRAELKLLLQVVDQALAEVGTETGAVVTMDSRDECWTYPVLRDRLVRELSRRQATTRKSRETTIVVSCEGDDAGDSSRQVATPGGQSSTHSPTRSSRGSPASPIHLTWRPSYSASAQSERSDRGAAARRAYFFGDNINAKGELEEASDRPKAVCCALS